jgi:hypothetical protein
MDDQTGGGDLHRLDLGRLMRSCRRNGAPCRSRCLI